MNEEKELGQISSTQLGYEDHGIFTFWIMFSFGGHGQGFGGYALDSFSKEKDERQGTKEGMNVIVGILRAMGVESWEELKGKTAWVYRDGKDTIKAIEAPEFVPHKGRFDIDEVFAK